MSIANNIEQVQERITRACARSGRNASDVTLVAVSKTFSAETVVEAYKLGLRNFGENRVEEAAEKIPTVRQQISNEPSASDLRWHLVGHLQSRKVREAAMLFDIIHSVDSARLAAKLDRLCVDAGRVMPILLECNVSGEPSKYGFAAAGEGRGELLGAVESIVAMPGLRVEGLMTVAPIVSDPEEARPVLRALRALRDELAARFPQASWRRLSMGMTDDFEIAVEEGATLVRIGRAIFGERPRNEV